MSQSKYIKFENLFPDFLPHIKCFKHKLRRRNGRGNPVDFSPEEKVEIKAAVMKMAKEFKI